MYQTDISTSSSQEKHYHPKRLLITLNEHPTQEQAQRSAILPEVSAAGLLLLTVGALGAVRRWWLRLTPDGTQLVPQTPLSRICRWFCTSREWSFHSRSACKTQTGSS